MNKEKDRSKEKGQKQPRRIISATGRRKKSSARVQMALEGKGLFLVNGKKWDEYFTTPSHKLLVVEPLDRAGLNDKVDVKAKVLGGGITGQAGAIRLGLSRAIVEYDSELKTPFKKSKLLTRDPRAKERKKYGQKGARRKFQWTKR